MVSEQSGRRTLLILLSLLTLSLRLYVFLSTGYAADDALITFRYAENLAAGKGFVYNAGEHVLGTTTPLNTILIFLFLKLGITPFWSSFVLSQLADLCSAWFLLRIFQISIQHPASCILSWLPAFVFLFNPETLQWSLSGMETETSIALTLAAGFLASRDRWSLAFAAASLAAFNRIDGVAVGGAVFCAFLIRKRALPWKPLAIAVLLLLPWLIFSALYFGSPIPNSVAAKAALSGHHLAGAFLDTLLKGFLHLTTFGAPLLILAILGTRYLWRDRGGWLALPIWTWGYAVSYTLAAGPMHAWYYAPFYAGYLVLVFLGLGVVANRIQWLRSRVVFAGIATVLVAGTLFASYRRSLELEQLQQRISAVNQAVGLWLNKNSPPDSVVAIKDIGFIGYYSKRKILDLAGLVSPECIPYRSRGDFLGPIAEFRPDYFAFSGGQLKNLNLEQSGLLRYYRPVKTVLYGTGSYTIFQQQ